MDGLTYPAGYYTDKAALLVFRSSCHRLMDGVLLGFALYLEDVLNTKCRQMSRTSVFIVRILVIQRIRTT